MRNNKGAPRTRLLYIFIGFCGGVIISRNAQPMSTPEKGSILLGMLILGFILWRVGYRDKNEAVATAVAVAVAEATANAEAHATAVAQQAVSVYIGAMERNNDPALKVIDSMTDTDSIESHTEAEELDHGAEDVYPVRAQRRNRNLRASRPQPAPHRSRVGQGPVDG